MSNENPYIGNGRLSQSGRCVMMTINATRLIALMESHGYEGKNGQYVDLMLTMKKQIDTKGNHYHVIVNTKEASR